MSVRMMYYVLCMYVNSGSIHNYADMNYIKLTFPIPKAPFLLTIKSSFFLETYFRIFHKVVAAEGKTANHTGNIAIHKEKDQKEAEFYRRRVANKNLLFTTHFFLSFLLVLKCHIVVANVLTRFSSFLSLSLFSIFFLSRNSEQVQLTKASQPMLQLASC